MVQGSGNRGLVAGLPWLHALHGKHDVLLCDGGDKLTLDREVVLGLVDACDAYVSLHRAEGFGRTLGGVSEFLCVRFSETCPRRRASLATNDRCGGQVGATYYEAALVKRSA